MAKGELLLSLLTTGPCGMFRFTKQSAKPAYFCEECRALSPDGKCERDVLRARAAQENVHER